MGRGLMTAIGRVLLAPALALGFPLFSCQYLSGASDLEIQAAAVQGVDWNCLGKERIAGSVSGSLDYKGSVRNVAGTKVIERVKLRFCDTADDVCDDASAFKVVTVTDGNLEFSIDRSFNGYIELESDGLLPGIVELSRRLGEMRTVPEFRMLDLATLSVFAQNMGASIEEGTGHALFWAEDCAGKRAPGVSVSALSGLNAATRGYYVLDQKLPSDSVNETDSSGGGGLINLTPGVLSFKAKVAGFDVPYSTFGGRIRPGELTFMVIEPD